MTYKVTLTDNSVKGDDGKPFFVLFQVPILDENCYKVVKTFLQDAFPRHLVEYMEENLKNAPFVKILEERYEIRVEIVK